MYRFYAEIAGTDASCFFSDHQNSRRYSIFGANFSPEIGSCIFLQNVGIYLQVHKALQPRRPTMTFSSIFDKEISG
jgi:hypothetical protein